MLRMLVLGNWGKWRAVKRKNSPFATDEGGISFANVVRNQLADMNSSKNLMSFSEKRRRSFT